jgi:hypothetical protein
MFLRRIRLSSPRGWNIIQPLLQADRSKRGGGMLTRKIEKNGLLIISMATASFYWYFDSLHTDKLIARIVTVSLFLFYGAFTQYLINMCKALQTELKEIHQEQILRTFSDRTNPESVDTLNQQDIKDRDRCPDIHKTFH